MSRYLVTFDFPGIHRYVFGADKARLVRGASGLLDRLNRQVVPEAFLGELGLDPGGRGDPGSSLVYANGGNGLFVVEAPVEKVRQAAAKAAGVVEEEGGGVLQLTFGWAEMENGSPFSRVLEEAIRHRTAERYRPGPPRADRWGKRPRCELCGEEPASGKPLEVADREWEHVGTGCHAREREWQRQKEGKVPAPWSRVLDRILGKDAQARAETLRPEDFETIGRACRAREGYIAVVYADGDGMGKIVQRIEHQETYRKFARIVDDSIVEATAAAARERFGDELAEGKTLGLDIILLGGDDLVAVVRADRAIPFALDVANKFKEETERRLREAGLADREPFRGNPLGLSCGVAIAHADQPFREIVDRAEELLRSAKTRREQGNPAIDFEDVSQGIGLSLEEIRRWRRTWSGTPILHGRRPLFVEDGRTLWEAVKALAAEGTVGNTRANNVFGMALEGPVAGSFELKRLLGRAAEKGGAEALRKFLQSLGAADDEHPGWYWVAGDSGNGEGAWVSPLADAAQLFPYARPAGGR